MTQPGIEPGPLILMVKCIWTSFIFGNRTGSV